VAQCVEALSCKPEVRGFDSRWWCHWNFSLTQSFRTMALGLTQPLTEMRGGKGGRYVGLTTLSPSFADCLEILGISTSWHPQGLSKPVMGLLFVTCTQASNVEDCGPEEASLCGKCCCVLCSKDVVVWDILGQTELLKLSSCSYKYECKGRVIYSRFWVFADLMFRI